MTQRNQGKCLVTLKWAMIFIQTPHTGKQKQIETNGFISVKSIFSIKAIKWEKTTYSIGKKIFIQYIGHRVNNQNIYGTQKSIAK
jgi:hypothetical protein